MVRWKSEAVVAWLELVVKMPMYGKACCENVKSGKVCFNLFADILVAKCDEALLEYSLTSFLSQ